MFPGYPAWLLATLSYLLSDDGLNGTDCVVGDNSNRCAMLSTGCGRFVPPFTPPFGTPGGYTLVDYQINNIEFIFSLYTRFKSLNLYANNCKTAVIATFVKMTRDA